MMIGGIFFDFLNRQNQMRKLERKMMTIPPTAPPMIGPMDVLFLFFDVGVRLGELEGKRMG
jgi:hypothetical protein